MNCKKLPSAHCQRGSGLRKKEKVGGLSGDWREQQRYLGGCTTALHEQWKGRFAVEKVTSVKNRCPVRRVEKKTSPLDSLDTEMVGLREFYPQKR